MAPEKLIFSSSLSEKAVALHNNLSVRVFSKCSLTLPANQKLEKLFHVQFCLVSGRKQYALESRFVGVDMAFFSQNNVKTIDGKANPVTLILLKAQLQCFLTLNPHDFRVAMTGHLT